MKRKFNILPFVLLPVFIIIVVWVQSTVTFSEDSGRNPGYDLYFTPEPEYVKMMSLGFNELAADIYWIRTVLYFGRRIEVDDHKYFEEILRGEILDDTSFIQWKRDVAYRFRYLYKMLDIVTDLNPYFLIPYTFGGLYLSLLAERPDLSVKILEKGSEYLDKEWRIPYMLGFNYYFFMNDSLKTAENFMKAATLPGCPPAALGISRKLLEKTAKKDVAIDFLTGMAGKTENRELREEIEKILEKLQSGSECSDNNVKYGENTVKSGAG